MLVALLGCSDSDTQSDDIVEDIDGSSSEVELEYFDSGNDGLDVAADQIQEPGQQEGSQLDLGEGGGGEVASTVCDETEPLPLLLVVSPMQDGAGWTLKLDTTEALPAPVEVRLYASLSSGDLETEVLDLGVVAFAASEVEQSADLAFASFGEQSKVAWKPSDYAGVIAMHGRVSDTKGKQIGWVHADGLYWRNDEAETKGAPRVFGEDEFATHRGDLHGVMEELKGSPEWSNLSRVAGQPEIISTPADEYSGALPQELQPLYQSGAELLSVGDPEVVRAGVLPGLSIGLPNADLPVSTSFPICVEWKVYTDDSNASFSPDLDTQLGTSFDAEDVYRDADLLTGQWGKARFGHIWYREYGLSVWNELWLDSNGCGVINNAATVSSLTYELQIQTEVKSVNGNRWRILDLPDGSFDEMFLPLPPLPAGLKWMTTVKSLAGGSSNLVRFDAGSGDPRLYWTPTAVLAWAMYREPMGLSATEVNFRVKRSTDASIGASNCQRAYSPEKRAYGAIGRAGQADAKFLVGHELGHCLDFLAANESDDRAWGNSQASAAAIINPYRSFYPADPDSVDPLNVNQCISTTPTLTAWTSAGNASGYHQLCDSRRGPKANPGAACNGQDCSDPAFANVWCFGTNPPRSYENSAIALSEGWAQFYSTRLFNDRAAQATQAWNVASASGFNLNVDVFVYGWSAYSFRSGHWLTYGGWLGNWCCGHADAEPNCMDGAGTVADWGAALWNLWALKQDGDASCGDTSILHMYAALDFAHAESNSDTSPTKAWEWFVDGFAPAPACQESNLVNLIGPRYGIDNN